MNSVQNARNESLRELSHFYFILEKYASTMNQKADALALLLWLHLEQGSTAGAIASSLGFSAPKTTRLLQKLITSGLLYEALDDNDLRKCLFFTTDDGEQAVRDAQEVLRSKHFAQSMKTLSHMRSASLLLSKKLETRITFTALRLLLALSAAAAPLNVGQLCKETCLPQPKASQALNTLINSGLIERYTQNSDKRKRYVVVSQKGDTVAAFVFAQLDPMSIKHRQNQAAQF